MKKASVETVLRRLVEGDKPELVAAIRRAAVEERASGKDVWGTTLEGFAARLEKKPEFEPKMLTLLRPNGKIAASLNAFAERVPVRGLGDVILNPVTRSGVDHLLLEHKSREKLADHGLHPQNRILLVGPPGSGKTLLAEVIAKETGKAFHVLQMGQLMDSLLGNTIRNIENSFAAIAQCDGVFLFDEFDALSTARKDQSDVNEMRRALNTLLQCMENLTGTSIIIAATNHPQSVDRAFRRRFDSIFAFSEPTDQEREEIIGKTLDKHKFLSFGNPVTKDLAKLTVGLSFDETEDLVKKGITDAVLKDSGFLNLEALGAQVRARKTLS